MGRKKGKVFPPEPLKRIYDVVSLLHPEAELSDPNETFDEYLNQFIQEHATDSAKERLFVYSHCQFKALSDVLIGLTSPFVDWVFDGNREALRSLLEENDLKASLRRWESFNFDTLSEVTLSMHIAMSRYKLARSWHTKLYALTDYLLKSSYLSEIDDHDGTRHQTAAAVGVGGISVIDDRLNFHTDRFVEAFEGQLCTRLRRCEICSKAFWATRSDSAACSVRCSRVRRTRKWRAGLSGLSEQKNGTGA